MLKGLLDNKTCAACKICCGFDNTDLWEMPIMNEKTAQKLKELKPETRFTDCGSGYVTDAGELSDGELFYCPALDHEKGCILGDDKPFDCRIWPFRVMETEDKRFRMITVSSVCPEIYSRPLSQLSEFVKEKLETTVFEYAEKNPDVIKKYIEGYPILAIIRKND